MAAYDEDVHTDQLHLAIIRFNMQAATFEFLREPDAIRLDAPRPNRCEIVDNRVCVFRVDQPTYFASYKFDERWQLVNRQVYLSAEANVRLSCLSHFYLACSRLWIHEFDSFDFYEKTGLACLKQIRYIERGHTALHSLSLKPLPKALDGLQDQAEKSNPKKVICAR